MALGDIVQTLPATIGGGRVSRPFSMGGRDLKPGHELSAAEIMAMPVVNRKALVERGWLHVWPASREQLAGPSEMHVVNVSYGRKWDVIEGRKIASGVSAEEVFELTGVAVGSVKKQEDLPVT